jgi:hypothetical protein
MGAVQLPDLPDKKVKGGEADYKETSIEDTAD